MPYLHPLDMAGRLSGHRVLVHPQQVEATVNTRHGQHWVALMVGCVIIGVDSYSVNAHITLLNHIPELPGSQVSVVMSEVRSRLRSHQKSPGNWYGQFLQSHPLSSLGYAWSDLHVHSRLHNTCMHLADALSHVVKPWEKKTCYHLSFEAPCRPGA